MDDLDIFLALDFLVCSVPLVNLGDLTLSKEQLPVDAQLEGFRKPEVSVYCLRRLPKGRRPKHSSPCFVKYGWCSCDQFSEHWLDEIRLVHFKISFSFFRNFASCLKQNGSRSLVQTGALNKTETENSRKSLRLVPRAKASAWESQLCEFGLRWISTNGIRLLHEIMNKERVVLNE